MDCKEAYNEAVNTILSLQTIVPVLMVLVIAAGAISPLVLSLYALSSLAFVELYTLIRLKFFLKSYRKDLVLATIGLFMVLCFAVIVIESTIIK